MKSLSDISDDMRDVAKVVAQAFANFHSANPDIALSLEVDANNKHWPDIKVTADIGPTQITHTWTASKTGDIG